MNCSIGENDKAPVAWIFILIFFVYFERIDIFAAVNYYYNLQPTANNPWKA